MVDGTESDNLRTIHATCDNESRVASRTQGSTINTLVVEAENTTYYECISTLANKPFWTAVYQYKLVSVSAEWSDTLELANTHN